MLSVMEMTPTPPPTISSFVIRFVIDPVTSNFRGEVRQIQTGEEIHFNRWDDVSEFIQRFIPVPLQDNSTDQHQAE